jgi:hypothetical protein
MPFAARSNHEFATAPATAADVLDEQGKRGVSSRYTGYIAPSGSTSSQTRAVTDSPYAVVGVAVQVGIVPGRFTRSNRPGESYWLSPKRSRCDRTACDHACLGCHCGARRSPHPRQRASSVSPAPVTLAAPSPMAGSPTLSARKLGLMS